VKAGLGVGVDIDGGGGGGGARNDRLESTAGFLVGGSLLPTEAEQRTKKIGLQNVMESKES